MADYTEQAAGNQTFTYNNDNNTDSASFLVRKWSSHASIFNVDKNGIVTLYGYLKRAASVDLNNSSASGDVAAFGRTGTTQCSIKNDATNGFVTIETPAATDNELHLSSAASVVLVLDYDNNDTGSSFQVLTYDGAATHLSVAETGEFYMYDGSTVTVGVTTSSNDTIVALGYGGRRGLVTVAADGTVGSERQGIFIFEDKNAGLHWVWVDLNGKLRIDTADPGTSDAPGSSVIVGTQS